jgi:hypothetical protein
MTADKITGELKAWIEYRSSEFSAASGWSVVLAGEDSEKSHPLVVLESTAAEEHEVLRGVMDPVTVEVRLETIPHEDGATSSATDEATQRAMNEALYCILGDREAVEWIDGRGICRCFDIRGSEGTLGAEDDKRTTVFEVRATCTTF